MRSRYSAYTLHNADYIIKTTHPLNIDFQEDKLQWKEEILEFSKSYDFNKLTIIEFVDNTPISYVTFTAHLSLDGIDNTFTEKSSFEKINNQWLYLNAI